MAWCKFGVDDVESEMTQPAKVQEPSMEEILASIRRIIADDEAKPSDNKPGDKAAAPAAAPPPKPAMKDIPPSAIASAPSAKAAAPAPAPKPAPAPAASNGQDDIDAMLASLEEVTPEEDVRPPQPDGEVFELTDDMALADEPPAQSAAAAFHKVDPQDDLEFTEAVAAARAAPRARAAEPPPMEMAVQAPMLSRTTVNAVESAFNTLANTVLSNNARTLEDLVKEMLRPMLKSWLDDNLPGLVERIVKAEIERVSRGR
jgi:cell pole-organizing protein PopZ